MEPDKGDQRVEESEKDMKPTALPTGGAKKPTERQGDDQNAVPALTKDLVRMIEVGDRFGFGSEAMNTTWCFSCYVSSFLVVLPRW